MTNEQLQTSDQAVPAQSEFRNLGTDQDKVKQVFDLYLQFQLYLQRIVTSFNSLAAGQIKSLNDLKTTMDQGGKEFLEDVLFKLSGKDVRIGGLTILKSKLPDLLISGDKESFYRACDDAKALQSKNHFLIHDFFTLDGEKIILLDQDLLKYLQEEYTHYRTKPEDIDLIDKIDAITKAWNDLIPYGQSLRNPGQFVEHIGSEESLMKPRYPFTPNWK